MVIFIIFLFLHLITGSASILDDHIDINSKLKSQLMDNDGSFFSRKLRSIENERLQSLIFKRLPKTGVGDHYRTGFTKLCRTLLSKLESKRCKLICHNGKCKHFCFKIREICTY